MREWDIDSALRYSMDWLIMIPFFIMYYKVIFWMNYVYPVLRYFCSICNTPLMETYKSIDIIRSSGEECPKCGSLLSESLKRKPVSQYQRDNSNSTTAASSLLCTQRFHTVSRLNFGIKRIDSILTFGIGECISLIGNYSKILIERLCIRALLIIREAWWIWFSLCNNYWCWKQLGYL